MNYSTTTYIYGPQRLPLTYTNAELNNIIEEFINNNKIFSFNQLCNNILLIADQQGKLKKKPNTSYSQILLTQHDTIRISKLLWDRIWDKRLILIFNNFQDTYHNGNETFFANHK